MLFFSLGPHGCLQAWALEWSGERQALGAAEFLPGPSLAGELKDGACEHRAQVSSQREREEEMWGDVVGGPGVGISAYECWGGHTVQPITSDKSLTGHTLAAVLSMPCLQWQAFSYSPLLSLPILFNPWMNSHEHSHLLSGPAHCIELQVNKAFSGSNLISQVTGTAAFVTGSGAGRDQRGDWQSALLIPGSLKLPQALGSLLLFWQEKRGELNRHLEWVLKLPGNHSKSQGPAASSVSFLICLRSSQFFPIIYKVPENLLQSDLSAASPAVVQAGVVPQASPCLFHINPSPRPASCSKGTDVVSFSLGFLGLWEAALERGAGGENSRLIDWLIDFAF